MKQKKTDILPYMILTVLGIILVGSLIYYFINDYNSTKATGNKIMEKTEEQAAEYEEYDIIMYDGEEIRGSQVVNFIKENLGYYEVSETAPTYVDVISVTSGITYTNRYVNKQYVKEIKNFSSLQYYIKPTAKFNCEVIRSTNKAILGVKFTQK